MIKIRFAQRRDSAKEGTPHLIAIFNSDQWGFTKLRVAIALLNSLIGFGRLPVLANRISSTSFQASAMSIDRSDRQVFPILSDLSDI
jgi:hypothetical protein